MTESSTWRTEWETVHSLHGYQKAEHIWAYYKLPISVALILAYILGYSVYRRVTRKDTILYVAFVNVAAGETTVEDLTTGFLRAEGLDTRKKQVISYRGLALTESDQVDRQYVYAAEMKLLASIDAEKLDIVIMDEEARDVFARNGYLADLRKNGGNSAHDTEIFWVDMSSSPLFQKAGFHDSVYLGVLANSPRMDSAESYIQYLMEK